MSLNKGTIKKLIKTAGKSKVKCKVAALALSRTGDIIAHTSNKPFRGSDSKFTIHAEEGLIDKLRRLKAFERLRGRITVIVLRLAQDDRIRNAKPCENCQKILNQYKSRINVLFTRDDGAIGQLWK